MDTTNDYRVLVAEDALARIEKTVRDWRLPYQIKKDKVQEILRNLKAVLLRLKYSYLPIDVILKSEELAEITRLSVELKAIILPKKILEGFSLRHRYKIAEIRYSLAILLGLKHRLMLGETNDPRNAVDVFGFRVAVVKPHSELKNLYITKVSSEKFSLTVVTNISNIKRGEVRGVAILPPRLFGEIISEGMYATKPLDNIWIGKRIKGEIISNEVVNTVYSILGR